MSTDVHRLMDRRKLHACSHKLIFILFFKAGKCTTLYKCARTHITEFTYTHTYTHSYAHTYEYTPIPPYPTPITA